MTLARRSLVRPAHAVRPGLLVRGLLSAEISPPRIVGPRVTTEAAAAISVSAWPGATVELTQIDVPSEPAFAGAETVTDPGEHIVLQAWPGATVEIMEG